MHLGTKRVRNKYVTLGVTLTLGLALLAIASLHLGVRQYGFDQVWLAVFGNGDDANSLIIRTLRIPRTLTAPLVGAGLAVAGLLLQTVSRNPLASPSLLGVNAGAAFAVVLAASLFGVTALLPLSAIACVGALCAISLIFLISASTGGVFTPTNTLLAGVTLAALLTSGTQIILVTDEATMETLLFWLSGSFTDRGLELLAVGAPLPIAGIFGAFLLNSHLDILLADDASAQALGVPVAQVRLGALAIAALMTGTAVVLAGPVAFIGLVAPHITRRIGGLAHRTIIPLTALVGANLALSADIVARFVIHPSEAPISTVLAFIGVPVLISILQSQKWSGASS